jgi:xanthine dehydrogenase accessory factor
VPVTLKRPDNPSQISLSSLPPVWVRGAGELGSAAALSLHRGGFRVFLSERYPPLAIRRTVTFSNAMVNGEATVESVTAKQFDNGDRTTLKWPQDCIPLFPDEPEKLRNFNPLVLVDARMIKHYDQDYRRWATLVIGLGPGFVAGQNCHAVIETMRGHQLGRIIWKGSAAANTGIPGTIGGESKRRVIHAPAAGRITWKVAIGDLVRSGEPMGVIQEDVPVSAPLDGMVRGLINPLVTVEKGLKIADVDPRGRQVDFHRVSDKSNAIGRAVLEAVLTYLNQPSVIG